MAFHSSGDRRGTDSQENQCHWGGLEHNRAIHTQLPQDIHSPSHLPQHPRLAATSCNQYLQTAPPPPVTCLGLILRASGNIPHRKPQMVSKFPPCPPGPLHHASPSFSHEADGCSSPGLLQSQISKITIVLLISKSTMRGLVHTLFVGRALSQNRAGVWAGAALLFC